MFNIKKVKIQFSGKLHGKLEHVFRNFIRLLYTIQNKNRPSSRIASELLGAARPPGGEFVVRMFMDVAVVRMDV